MNTTNNKAARQPKPLTELTLLNRFLFNEVMEQPENLRVLLEIILGKEILLKYLPETERETRTSPIHRFIKLDVWAMEEDTVYNAEVQQKNTQNLPKRSRYYQGMIDSKLLKPGVVDFNELNDIFIIIITPFDLFGQDRYLYTFQMQCEEVPGLHLQDGAARIFINTHGKNPEDISDDLLELLHLIEHTNDHDTTYHNKNLQKMSERVREIQNNAEVSVKYMQAWEERVLDRQEAREEGRKQLLSELIQKKLEKGLTMDQIADALEIDASRVKELIREMETSG